MESHEQIINEAESQAQRLGEEGDRVGRRIEETRSDVKSKDGTVPGVALPDEDETPAAPDEAAEEGEEPNETSVD